MNKILYDRRSFFTFIRSHYEYYIDQIEYPDEYNEYNEDYLFSFDELYELVNEDKHDELKGLIDEFKIDPRYIITLLDKYYKNDFNIIYKNKIKESIKIFDDLFNFIIANSKNEINVSNYSGYVESSFDYIIELHLLNEKVDILINNEKDKFYIKQIF